jgi:hypothetical protein
MRHGGGGGGRFRRNETPRFESLNRLRACRPARAPRNRRTPNAAHGLELPIVAKRLECGRLQRRFRHTPDIRCRGSWRRDVFKRLRPGCPSPLSSPRSSVAGRGRKMFAAIAAIHYGLASVSSSFARKLPPPAGAIVDKTGGQVRRQRLPSLVCSNPPPLHFFQNS